MQYFLAFLCLLPLINSLNILGVVPSVPKTHSTITQAFFKELAKRGHHVTVVSAYPLKTPVENYTDIVLTDLKHKYIDNTVQKIDLHKTHTKWAALFLYQSMTTLNKWSKVAIEDRTIERVKNLDKQFDVVIVEIFFNEVFFALAHHFNAPLIVLTVTGHLYWTDYLAGNPTSYAYVPESHTTFNDDMNFVERACNTFIFSWYELCYNYVHLTLQEELRQKHFPNAPHINELVKNVSLIFVYDDISLTYPRPLMPNVIEIGGQHVQPAKPLPGDLKTLLDQAKHGVIYFSMGTSLNSNDFPSELKTIFLNEFRKLKQLVFWKYDDNNLPDKPDNVIIRKWFPQSDLLAHPNIKIFITHGGILSIFESLTREVPLLGIPIFGDQKMNAAKVNAAEIGLLLSYENITSASLSWALNELINNPKYKENIGIRSRILKDNVVDRMDVASFYIDYVVRHNGAKHLKSAVLKLSWYQRMLLDVLALYFILFSLILSIFYILCKKILYFLKNNVFPTKKNLNKIKNK